MLLRAWLVPPVAIVLVACAGPAGGGISQPTNPPTTAPVPTATLAPTVTAQPTATLQPIVTVAAIQPPTATSTTPPLATRVPTTLPAATAAAAPVLTATPACPDGDEPLTVAQTEGPYFKPNSPERVSLLAAGLGGTRLTLTGRVLTTTCQPVARALLDFWQADDKGVYDNTGFTMRGHQFTDEAGRYRLETVVPGLYPGRTRHIHVKVQAPNGPVLTTQLYFAGEARNASDGIFNPKLVMTIQDAPAGKQGAFDFVVAAR
jgi:protocatechuate 3,4-dioxygenase beta subunit